MSSRSGWPRMWFSMRGQHEGERERVRRLGGGRDPLGGVALVVQVAAGVPILDRASDGARLLRHPDDRPGGALRSGAVAVLRSTETGRSVACVKPDTWETTSSSVTLPSSWPSVKAKPELVVASAWNPMASRTRADPTSHGLGTTNGGPSCRARNAAALSTWDLIAAPPARPCHACRVS